MEISLVVQWLRLQAPKAGGPGSILGQGTRSCMPQLGIPQAATKTWRSCVLSHSVVSDSATAWTVAYSAALCMGFPGEEYWSELPLPSPGDLPDPGIDLVAENKTHLAHTSVSPKSGTVSSV